MPHNLNALIFVMKLFFKVNKTNQKKMMSKDWKEHIEKTMIP